VTDASFAPDARCRGGGLCHHHRRFNERMFQLFAHPVWQSPHLLWNRSFWHLPRWSCRSCGPRQRRFETVQQSGRHYRSLRRLRRASASRARLFAQSKHLLNDLHDRQIRIRSQDAFASQLFGIVLEPLRLKDGAAVLSMIVAAEPDIDISRVRHTEGEVLLASNLGDLNRDLRMGNRRDDEGEIYS
jgi:hypothetical protein